MHAFTIVHLQAVKRILRYLKGSLGRGLTITPGGKKVIASSLTGAIESLSRRASLKLRLLSQINPNC